MDEMEKNLNAEDSTSFLWMIIMIGFVYKADLKSNL